MKGIFANDGKKRENSENWSREDTGIATNKRREVLEKS